MIRKFSCLILLSLSTFLISQLNSINDSSYPIITYKELLGIEYEKIIIICESIEYQAIRIDGVLYIIPLK